jgi:hypothetical protein
MKKFIYSALGLIFTVFAFVSCDDTFTDLMTANVKTGGLVIPTSSIPYKLGSTPNVTVTLDIPEGPGIESIEVYRTFTDKTEVLDQTISVASANTTDDVSKEFTLTYTDLIEGLSMPADEGQLEIGDKWTIRYVSIMSDGRSVENANTTVIAVANFFAGSYEKDMKYFHPTAGGTYPTTPYSAYTEKVDLVAINAYECEDWFGVWEDTHITIHIDPAQNYAVSLTFEDRSDVSMGDPNNAANVCSYDPVTGVIKLYYNYSGSGGYRIFWVVYTPE